MNSCYCMQRMNGVFDVINDLVQLNAKISFFFFFQ